MSESAVTPRSKSKSISEARQLEYVAFLHRVPFAIDAYRLGFTTGVREDYKLQQRSKVNSSVPVEMLDNDFRDPDVDRWIEIFSRYDPSIGVLADIYSRDEAIEYVEVAEQLHERFPESDLMVVPKCDCFDLLPEWMILGYPAGGQSDDDYKPESFSTIDQWRGRKVHILGGSPPVQWERIQKLTQPTLTNDPPADVIGVDWNGISKVAYLGEKWTRDGWERADHEQIRQTVRMGLKEIREFWKDKGIWPKTTPRERLGEVQLRPVDEVFAMSGKSPADQKDPAELCDTLCVEYENGRTFMFESEHCRKRFEYEMGYGSFSSDGKGVKRVSTDL